MNEDNRCGIINEVYDMLSAHLKGAPKYLSKDFSLGMMCGMQWAFFYGSAQYKYIQYCCEVLIYGKKELLTFDEFKKRI